MTLTPYHARYYAALLTKRSGMRSVERYLPALVSAGIDLHPHQIDAAMFAARSQFRDGVILADEEGIGKTIEAGIALLQASIENRTRLLVLCPPTLLQHWRNELWDKFSLPCIGLHEADEWDSVVLLSYQAAVQAADRIAAIRWDLCVLDEAHRLANAGMSEHKTADTIRAALSGCPKLLLTATPMQNSLLDLYYLIRFVDETAFGSDPEVFRERYMGSKPLKEELVTRAQIICQRTLKRQALTMQPTKRIARTLLVPPTPKEDALSKRMSLYFHRESLLAFPKIQEHYIRLTYWKLLASSPAALCASLERVIKRLEKISEAEDERRDLCEVLEMAAGIKTTARSRAFLDALKNAMRRLEDSGVPRKAVVFSENLTTLAYLHDLLSANGYKNRIAVYSGGEKGHKALEAFRDRACVLLATDSAGAGLDLSHCALVINYDMPWNVQKLEQRISRCHRYGQKHDVLVVNFIDPTNRADRRLYELLNKKLKMFDSVFGASETVLGDVQDADSDTRISVRTEEEIARDTALFEQENKAEIERRVKKAEADLLAHFDDDVRERFRAYGESVPESLSQMEHWLWEITRYKLQGKATIFEDQKRVFIDKSPYKGLRLSRLSFGMDKSLPKGERYRLDHPLAKRVLEDCSDGKLIHGTIVLEAGKGFSAGMSGEIGLWKLHMLSGVDYQTHPVLCGYVKGGSALLEQDLINLMKLPPLSFNGGMVTYDENGELISPPEGECDAILSSLRDKSFTEIQNRVILENNEALEEELSKLRHWAEDETAALSMKRDALKEEASRLKSKQDGVSDFAERFRLNKELAELTKRRQTEEERLFYMGAEIQQKRDELMARAREKSAARFWDELLFVTRWEIR